MNLERHLAVLWRRRFIILCGIALGIVLAVLSAYRFDFDRKNFERRGVEQWQSDSRVLVTQAGFPEGRVAVPPSAAAKFADPVRFNALAILYSFISGSDRVRASLPGNPAPEQISAVPLVSGNGNNPLPIIAITTMAETERAAVELNVATIAALRNLLTIEQERASIPPDLRVRVDTLNAPRKAVLANGRSLVSSIIAFMLCLAAAVAVAHLADGVRRIRKRKPLTDDVQLDWSPEVVEPRASDPGARLAGSTVEWSSPERIAARDRR